MKETLDKIVMNERESTTPGCNEWSKGENALSISSPLCTDSEMLYAYKNGSWESVFGSEDDTLADFITNLYQKQIICEGDLIETFFRIKSMLKIQ